MSDSQTHSKTNRGKESKDFIALINTRNITILCVLIGLIFPLSAWIFDIVFSGQSLSLGGLINIHKSNTLHYFVDMLPLLLGVIGFFYRFKN